MPTNTTNPPLALFCTLGLRGVLVELTPVLAAQGLPIAAIYESTNTVKTRLASGETADIAILIDETIAEMASTGVLIADTCADIARSGVAIAVKAGTAKPDISTPEAFIQTLKSARAIAYTKNGASGIYFASLIARLGIAEEINRKAVVRDGFTGELAASGEVEIAVQQTSELFPVAGIDIVGPLPAALQKMTVFTAGVFAASPRVEAAKAVVSFLSSPQAVQLICSKGLEPAGAFA